MNSPESPRHTRAAGNNRPKVRLSHPRTARMASLAASALAIAAIGSCTHRDEPNLIPHAQPSWALVSAAHRDNHDGSLQILVNIDLVEASIASGWLDALAINIAREPGVLTLESGESLHLPASEGFRAIEVLPDGVIMTRQGHDPSLRRIGDQQWQIVLPINDQELRQRVRTGTNIVINPAASTRSLGAFQGVSFVWPGKSPPPSATLP